VQDKPRFFARQAPCVFLSEAENTIHDSDALNSDYEERDDFACAPTYYKFKPSFFTTVLEKPWWKAANTILELCRTTHNKREIETTLRDFPNSALLTITKTSRLYIKTLGLEISGLNKW
jgi:hypothetical protein